MDYLFNNQQVAQDYNQITKLDPEYSFAYSWRAKIYMKQGQYDKAIDEYDKAYEVEKDEVLKEIRLGDKKKAILERADNYIKQGEYDKAVVDYDTVFKMTDDNDSYDKNKYLSFRRNVLYKKTNDIRYLDTPIRYAVFDSPKRKKQFTDTLLKHGDSYLKAEEYALAVEDYTQVINVDPDNKKALLNRAFAYENLGEYKKSLADYDKSLELDPKNDVAKNNRQRVLDKMKK